MNPGLLYNESNNNYEPTVVLDQRPSQQGQGQNENNVIDDFLAGRTLADIERRAIIATIRGCNGNKAASARSLGISEKSIYNKMKRLKITNADLFGEPSEPAAPPLLSPPNLLGKANKGGWSKDSSSEAYAELHKTTCPSIRC